MKEIKINANSIFFVISIFFLQCKEEKAAFFTKYRPNENDFLTLRDTSFYYQNSKIVGYNMEFPFEQGGKIEPFEPASGLYGRLFMQNNQIYCISFLGQDAYVFFDFNLNKGEEKAIQYSYKATSIVIDEIFTADITKKYQLILDCIDYDEQQDTVYTFRFEKFGHYTEQNDLVMQVSKERGILSYGFLVDKKCLSTFNIPCYPKATRPLRACQ